MPQIPVEEELRNEITQLILKNGILEAENELLRREIVQLRIDKTNLHCQLHQEKEKLNKMEKVKVKDKVEENHQVTTPLVFSNPLYASHQEQVHYSI